MARTRSRTGRGQWLLLVALLFGIVTMHTLGHPSGGHDGGAGSGHGTAGHAVGAGAGRGAGPGGVDGAGHGGVRGAGPGGVGEAGHGGVREADHGAGHEAGYGAGPGGGGTGAVSAARVPAAHAPAMGHGDDRVMRVAAPAPAPSSEPHGGMATDPLSVCLAVLGAFTLALLVRAGLLRPGGTLVRAPALQRLLLVQRPQPPPPRALLSRLSVLRI